MPTSRFVIRQCTRPGCLFRFPVETDFKRANICPKCGAETTIAVEIPPGSAAFDPGPIPTLPRLEAFLDNIRSTFNVGAIFRTADGAGFSHLHLCGITPTPENPKVGKTALGAEAGMAWSYHLNSLMAARELKRQGAVLWALEGIPSAVSLFQAIEVGLPPAPVVLIAGNELSGVDPELLELCDRVLWIPMQGSKESLNVAVAFSIAAYTLRYVCK
jgi:tRNA G18 (ribose-2'-O)-methylase SpoU